MELTQAQKDRIDGIIGGLRDLGDATQEQVTQGYQALTTQLDALYQEYGAERVDAVTEYANRKYSEIYGSLPEGVRTHLEAAGASVSDFATATRDFASRLAADPAGTAQSMWETAVSEPGRTGGAVAAFLAGHQAVRLFADEETGWFSMNGLLAVVAGFASAVAYYTGGHDWVMSKIHDLTGNGEAPAPETDHAAAPAAPAPLRTSALDVPAEDLAALAEAGVQAGETPALSAEETIAFADAARTVSYSRPV